MQATFGKLKVNGQTVYNAAHRELKVNPTGKEYSKK